MNCPGLWPVFSWIVLEKLRAWNRAHPKLAACHAECVSVCLSVCLCVPLKVLAHDWQKHTVPVTPE